MATQYRLTTIGKRPALFVKGCEQYILVNRDRKRPYDVRFIVLLNGKNVNDAEDLEFPVWTDSGLRDSADFFTALGKLVKSEMKAKAAKPAPTKPAE